jgi:drug/metabolite transporter (DMT)-like permease
MTKSLHKLGLLACAAKIIAGTIYYSGMEIAKETCIQPMLKKQTTKCEPGFERWSRPFFAAAILFFGMTFTLIPFFVLRNGKTGVPRIDGKVLLNMFIPATLEFVGQVMFLMGLNKIPVALSLTMKGSRVAFSALFVVVFLKRKLWDYHWVSVAVVLLGLGVASVPEIVESKSTNQSSGAVLLGLGLTLGGEFVRAFKGVYEEKLLKKLHYDTFMVVGLQGLMAFLWSVPAVAVVDAIDVENFSDTWDQFTYHPLVWSILSLSPITVSALFISGAYVTKLMSAVHNALTGSITNAITWLLSILIHVIDAKVSYGHRGLNVKPIHIVQVVGFLIVVFASMAYDAMIKFPFFTYPADRAEASGAGTNVKTHPSDPDLVVDEDIRETADALGIKEDEITVESDEEDTTVYDDEAQKMIETSSPNMRRRT